MTIETTTVPTKDGRILCVESGGDPSGRSVLAHMGTPNSRHLFAPFLEDADRRGIHLLCYDRPGYGGSTPDPGRSVASCAADVRAIADAFGIDRLAVWGHSGGGPHALACAALLPDLVCAVASLASVAPYGADDLDFFSGMGQDNVDDIRLYLNDPAAARQKSASDREELLQVTPELVVAALATLVSPTDVAALTPALSSYLVRCSQDGLAPGDEGWWEDDVAHFGYWGFELESIAMPVQVWHGQQDRFVPFQHGQWLAQHVPGADARLSADDGHLTLFDRVPIVHEWLLGHF